MKKKILALLTGMVMCLTMIPSIAFAAEDGSQANPFTSISEYNAKVEAFQGQDVYVEITGGEFTVENPFQVYNTQNMENPPKLHLTLTGCSFKGNTANDSTNPSFMYLPNCKELNISGCTFNSDAGLKYGINWNLIGVTDAQVSIINSKFIGTYEKNAIKLNQRNGADDKASDVKGGNTNPASIASAVISGCTFDENVKIALGSQGKNEGSQASPSTGEFPITITDNKSDVNVVLDYAAAGSETSTVLQIYAEDALVKTKDADITVKYTSGESVTYYIGNEADIKKIAANAKNGDKIEIIDGDANLTISAGGVTVSNKGGGIVTINGMKITDDFITEEQPVETDPSKPVTTEEPDTSKDSPNTGDDFNMTAVIAIMAIAAAASAGTMIYGRRKRSN